MCEGPSDRTAFEAAIKWLAAEDVRLGGTAVTDLGGNGCVWGNREELLRKVDIVRRIAPYASHSLIIDRDSRTADEIAALRTVIEQRGIHFEVFPMNELENLWLTAPLTHAILKGLAEDATAKTGEEVAAPALADVAAALAAEIGENAIADLKGSRVLNKLCDQFTLRQGKTDPARIAVANIQTLAKESATLLTNSVRNAITAPPPQAQP
jgi:hypothetical protein